MATDAQSLMTQGQCFSCFGNSMYFLTLMRLALWRQYLLQLNPGATVDPQGLLNLASCYSCFGSNKYALQLMRIAMLAQMASGQVTPPPVVPPATPTNFTGEAFAFSATFSWTEASDPALDFLLTYSFSHGGPYNQGSVVAAKNLRTVNVPGIYAGTFWVIQARDSVSNVSAISNETAI